MTGTPTTQVAEQLKAQFGLDTVTLHYGLSQDELFHAAIANDRGRVRPNGPDDEQKAYPTALGVDGPLAVKARRSSSRCGWCCRRRRRRRPGIGPPSLGRTDDVGYRVIEREFGRSVVADEEVPAADGNGEHGDSEADDHSTFHWVSSVVSESACGGNRAAST